MNSPVVMRQRYGIQYEKKGTINKHPGTGAQQHFKNECNIKTIMQRAKQGIYPQGSNKVPCFGDFTGIVDYQTCLQAITKAEEGFMSLPAKVRDKFKNNPQALFDFIADERNRPEAIEIGLIPKPEEKTVKIGDPIEGSTEKKEEK